MTLTGLPLEFDGKRPPYRFSAPKLGEHNDLLASDAGAEESRLMKDLKYETLALEQPSEHLLVVRFNRPEVRNAISTQVGRDMLDLFARFQAPNDYRCMVLTGTGDKAFCAGGDLKERHGMTDEQWLRAARDLRAHDARHSGLPDSGDRRRQRRGVRRRAANSRSPATSSTPARAARFALTEVTLGIMPGGGGTQFLPRAAGLRRAKEIILTGKPFSAQEALDWGMVNKVCAPEKLMEEALATAQTICDNAPISVRQAKRSMHFGVQMDVRSALFFEVDAYNRMVGTEDRHEGVRAFNEKRKPKFKGKVGDT